MKITNPLTIVAIFAGLAETSATIALVNLPLEIQNIFIYFVMYFPLLLVLIFFLVLYTKNTVFYAPSDYSNQSHYLEINKIKASVNERIEDIFSELNQSGQSLTREDIDKAKNAVDASIEEVTVLPKKEEILKFLMEHPASVSKISEELGFNRKTVQMILYKLREEALVQDSSDRPKVWSANI